MASGDRHVDVRLRKGLSEQEIDGILNESEFDFSGDDSDGDPEFLPPNLEETKQDRRNSDSSSSDDDTSIFTPQTASPAFSDDLNSLAEVSSTQARPRGRARGTSRCRNRGRAARSQSVSTRQIAIRNRQNNTDVQDTWIHEKLDTVINDLMQPSYINKYTENWEWHQFYDQYIDDDILNTIVDCTNRTHVLETGKSMGLTLKELKVYIGITMIMSAL
ncbi:uncharacterized protein LOC132904279 [Amyelois transitella]|uniref:uncharacterized protein LOC132904279 n=1 Tax=Amyelois transitella TaxID=680683 RepID=UPI00298FBC50|nr:uncharacterized protein LOC132904279 [Amyelois transitella]